MTKKKHYHLYVLELNDSKYYVGITTQTVERRFFEHAKNIRSAAWTRKYKPIRIHDQKDLGWVTEESAKAFENKVTLKYIKKYGLDNVRGGDVTQTEKYVERLGYIFVEHDWEALAMIIFLTLTCIILAGLYEKATHPNLW